MSSQSSKHRCQVVTQEVVDPQPSPEAGAAHEDGPEEQRRGPTLHKLGHRFETEVWTAAPAPQQALLRLHVPAEAFLPPCNYGLGPQNACAASLLGRHRAAGLQSHLKGLASLKTQLHKAEPHALLIDSCFAARQPDPYE